MAKIFNKECVICGNSFNTNYHNSTCCSADCKKKRNDGWTKKTQSNEEYIKNQRYLAYKKNAIKRGYVFNLSREEFDLFWKKPCGYCGSDVITIGLDRIDNKNGYYIGNVIPCCKICNSMKLIQPQSDFLNHIKKIYDYQQYLSAIGLKISYSID